MSFEKFLWFRYKILNEVKSLSEETETILCLFVSLYTLREKTLFMRNTAVTDLLAVHSTYFTLK